MQNLIKQEQFELEVLDKLNSKKLLDSLIFCGGTMLRLCFGLDRFSVDLDFWIENKRDNKLFNKLKTYLAENYAIKDAAEKFYTMLFEIKSKNYPRALKIEIRKDRNDIRTEKTIAYSHYSNKQVLLRTATLEEMMQAKIEAFINRKEIRDVFDIEFMVKKGIKLNAPPDILKKLLKNINKLTKKDYSVKLGSVLEDKKRKYYVSDNFKILKREIQGG